MGRWPVIDDVADAGKTPGWFPDPWDPLLLRYFDGVQWTGSVMASPPVASFAQASGYPLGEPVLYLRAIPGRFDREVSCAVEGGRGQQLGFIRSVGRVPVAGQETSSLTFEVIDPGGRPMMFIACVGNKAKQRLHVADNNGRHLGQLRQVSSYWRQLFRTSRVTMQIESGTHVFATTDVSIDPQQRDVPVNEPIRDPAGGTLGAVERQWRATETMNDYFDYRLNCVRITSDPLPRLLLVAVFAHYLYDRLAVGGPVGALGKAISRPTWET